MSKTILVVDDDKKLRDMIAVYLEQEGYRVVMAGNGREALYVARYEKPDLIILDIMMPEMDGYEFMRLYSREAETPVIMLTAKVEEGDKVLGLEIGADDYIEKPFSVRELLARVRAILRRANRQTAVSDMLRVADVSVDRAGRLVMVRETAVDLTPSEFEILTTLMASPGRTFSRLDLLDRMSGEAYEGYERTVDVHIRNLRTKIEQDPSNPDYIETVYGMGYRFAMQGK
jgi:DNA-binding response OmpR family regulator